ncbi:MAG: 1-acyl-sn-glycerol-3-phosphate acyltransferase [Spirochaetales bacterium]|nr:1-acyl-sn-glycerol-3-phosphate acyltransferase [Spirochaetales bacterium]
MEKRKSTKKTIRPSKCFNYFTKIVLGSFLRVRYRIQIIDPEKVRKRKGPFILVANHVNFWDPFMIDTLIRPPLQFVTSDNIFRGTVFRILMKLYGSIPKTKFMPDPSSAGNLLRVLHNGGVVGIYPEGRRTWDGDTIELIPDVSRLLYRLKIPVAAVIIDGGYLSKPRWGHSFRKGRVTITFSTLLETETYSQYDQQSLHSLLTHTINHSDTDSQKKDPVPYRGKKPAEYLEQLIFLCPECKSFGTMYSENDMLSCTHCGYQLRYDEYGFFHLIQGTQDFESPRDLNNKQLDLLRNIIKDHDEKETLFSDGQLTIYTGYRAEPLIYFGRGRAEFFLDRIVVHIVDGSGEDQIREFSVPDIQGINVQNKEKLEFYYNWVLYRFDFENPRISSYKWFKTVQLVQELRQRGNA